METVVNGAPTISKVDEEQARRLKRLELRELNTNLTRPGTHLVQKLEILSTRTDTISLK